MNRVRRSASEIGHSLVTPEIGMLAYDMPDILSNPREKVSNELCGKPVSESELRRYTNPNSNEAVANVIGCLGTSICFDSGDARARKDCTVLP